MDDVRLLMVVKEPEARAAYEEALREVPARYDVAGSFDEVLRLSLDTAYSGLIIDILTLIRSSKEEKVIAYDCLNFYPSLRVKWDPRQRSMILSPLEKNAAPGAHDTLRRFVETRCRPFTARTLRRFERKETCLSLLLCDGDDSAGRNGLKTFTVNISQGGAFVHTTSAVARGERVWLRFLELGDAAPVCAEVCWGIPWGTCRSISGIGVKFHFADDRQRSAVTGLARG